MKPDHRKFLLGLAALVIVLMTRPAAAQETSLVVNIQDVNNYPTLIALTQTDIPPINEFQLARDLLNLEIANPPISPEPLAVGTEDTFDTRGGSVTATLAVVGEYVYIWVENSVGMVTRQADVEALADFMDNEMHSALVELWGVEDTGGIDGDVRIHILFTPTLNRVAGTFGPYNLLPKALEPDSNEKELLDISLAAIGYEMNSDLSQSIISHEVQHLYRAFLDYNEDIWLNESISAFTEVYLGYEPFTGFLRDFLQDPNHQLNRWQYDLASYGAGLMFMTYFYERYGVDAVKTMSIDPTSGLQAFDNTLLALGEPGINAFFADWVLANVFNDKDLADGRYGYTLLSSEWTASDWRYINAYPFRSTYHTSQYGTEYFNLNSLDGVESLEISVSAPETTRLLPHLGTTDNFFWHSSLTGRSDTRLTRAFDLRAVDSATLEYDFWAYMARSNIGIVLVSVDGGATWERLETSEMNGENRYGKGYGDIMDDWQHESISLDAYTGKEILVRFQVIKPFADDFGLMIDNVAIPEIGYEDNFENGAGGWQAEGWIRIDNLLPQTMIIQVAQVKDHDVILSRWFTQGDYTATLEVLPDADRVLLAISPSAPATVLPVRFELDIRKS